MKRLTLSAFGVFVAAIFTSGFGCELITSPDRSKIDGGSGGVTTSTTGGGGSTGGTTTTGGGGNTGGVTGGTGGVTGGTGGTGGVVCQTPADCPDPGNACVTSTCNMGVCGTDVVPAGTLAGNQMAGDCKVFKCNGAGTLEALDDDADLPVDNNDCTDDVCTTGTPSNPPVAAGGTCASGQGSMCDGNGACVQCLVADDCPGQDTECQTRTCDLGVCGTMNAMVGTPVAAQTVGDCLKNECDGNGSTQAVPDDLDVVNDGNDCTDNTCVNGAPMVANTAINTACGAGGALKCDGAGLCVGCTGPGDCSNGGNACLDAVCNAGTCGTAPKTNGTACNDGDSCTQSDTCQNGACTGANPVVCTALDQCHQVGACDSGTGVCSNPTKANGASCSDGNACTQSDTCQAGSCAAGTPITCTASDQCHDAGTCNPGTGVCSNPNKTNGASCNDNNLCTQTDTCQTGVCTGSNPVVCMASDQCHDVGTCAPATGVCSNPNKTNGSACNDGDLCTQTDTCQTGVCTGGNPKVCTASDQCHDAGTCAPATGVCSNPNKMNGAACNDANGCTQSDTCQNGTCTGANPVVCMPSDACHVAGTCAPATGMCDNPNAADGTMCAGGLCSAGTCVSFTCNDMTKNGTETDVDCGGGAGCPTCALGKTCAVNGDCASTHCVGTVCVQCAVANDCPGVDNDCQTRTCNAGVCGFNYQPNGTVAATQTTGDCKENQCDGAGVSVPVNKDTDLPVDANQCTDNVCTTGTPSNPASALGTVCSQNGGTKCDGQGNCVNPPTVTGTTPADGAANAAAWTTIAVTFSKPMNPASLTGQTAIGACTGSIQISRDNFASCLPFAAAAPTMTGGNTIATLTPAPSLSFGATYKIKVLASAADAVGLTLGTDFVQPTGFGTGTDFATGSGVVIAEVYGQGGNANATYNADFVVLHNRGTAVASIGGWSIQYASAAGNFGSASLKTTLPATVDLQPGAYYLVQMSGAGATGAAFTADFYSGTSINMSGTAGKVALVNSGTTLPVAACVIGNASVVDLVGYGSQVAATGCWETLPTGATAPTHSSVQATWRRGSGCGDSGDNSFDFEVLAPSPKSTASPAVVCGFTQNEKGSAAELDYCNLQFPTVGTTVATGALTETIYAQAYEAGVTDPAGPAAGLIAQIGYGPKTVNPENQSGWVWTNATFNVQVGNNDEWQAQITAPAAGSYYYTSRFSFDGVQWTYCDLNGAGSNAGLSFEIGQLPTMTVTP